MYIDVHIFLIIRDIIIKNVLNREIILFFKLLFLQNDSDNYKVIPLDYFKLFQVNMFLVL